MKVVALSGKMHSGKSWVADRLVEEYGFKRVSFAAALKDDVLHMGFPPWAIKEKPDWMRKFMQVYGQARRAVNPNYWIYRVIEQIEFFHVQGNLFLDEPLIVIDDMRFENEMDELTKLEEEYTDVEAYFIRIDRENYDRSGIPGHDEISETDLDNVDLAKWTQKWTVESGDLEGLKFVADDIANVMGVTRSG